MRAGTLLVIALCLAGCGGLQAPPEDAPLPRQGTDQHGNGCLLVRGKADACQRDPDGYGQSADCRSLREQCPWLW